MIKTALTAAVIFGTASVALASEADPNLLNRYPAFNMTKQVAAPAFETRNVALGSSVIGGEVYIDRASQTFGGGY